MKVLVDKNNYKKRIVDKQIEDYLKVAGAICIEDQNGAEKLGHPLIIQTVSS